MTQCPIKTWGGFREGSGWVAGNFGWISEKFSKVGRALERKSRRNGMVDLRLVVSTAIWAGSVGLVAAQLAARSIPLLDAEPEGANETKSTQ